ncbi:unnamed protein product [Enterobius vermicularis]|uniref:Uncharacterized protein n=1 Tax=Enterobius vermicularis TaxID=51028 RepID=A0A0N4VLN3_ENTVE|nr:unnamed protein product [Enterobius vermicularis]
MRNYFLKNVKFFCREKQNEKDEKCHLRCLLKKKNRWIKIGIYGNALSGKDR